MNQFSKKIQSGEVELRSEVQLLGLLSNNIVEVIEKEALQKKLESGVKLRIKLGFDPTSPDLHLGHYVVLKKVREFQDLGHKLIIIIGDFTALIGDPSGRNKLRPALSPKEIKKNAKTYFDQLSGIINIKKAEIHYNSEWFKKFKMVDFLKLLSGFTVQRILERDDFSNRLKNGTEIYSHELIYPMIQAYDSIVTKADIEIGGTDQRFNMLAGRDLARRNGVKEQDVITCPLLVGLDGQKKMSKSLGNYIGLLDQSDQKFGKIMSLPDELMAHYFELVLGYSLDQKNEILDRLKKENPKDIKLELALKITALFDGLKKAELAKENFTNIFKLALLPKEIKEITLDGEHRLDDLLLSAGLANSKSEARRLITQKGVSVDNLTVDTWSTIITIPLKGIIIRVGKLKFVRIISSVR